jgi:hypothetical protein
MEVKPRDVVLELDMPPADHDRILGGTAARLLRL